MASLTRFLQSTILSKIVMAATGFALVMYLIIHMCGNLLIYYGRDHINTYGMFLHSLGPILLLLRLILLLCLILHVWTSIRLKFLNMSARPVPYAKKQWIKASLTSRTMLLSGVTIFTFVVYHVMHFTLGTTNPEHFHFLDPSGKHDVYSMVILGFQQLPISITYFIAMILVGFHLNHAIGSMFQTLGVSHPKYDTLIERGSAVLSVILVIGFLSVPIGVLSVLLKLPAGVAL